GNACNLTHSTGVKRLTLYLPFSSNNTCVSPPQLAVSVGANPCIEYTLLCVSYPSGSIYPVLSKLYCSLFSSRFLLNNPFGLFLDLFTSLPYPFSSIVFIILSNFSFLTYKLSSSSSSIISIIFLYFLLLCSILQLNIFILLSLANSLLFLPSTVLPRITHPLCSSRSSRIPTINTRSRLCATPCS